MTASSALLIEAEQTQERLQQGPVRRRSRMGDIVKSADLAPRGEVARAATGADRVVVPSRGRDPAALRGSPARQLNLYDSTPRDWSDDDMRSATILADMAVGYVINASQLEQAERTASSCRKPSTVASSSSRPKG